MKRRAAKTPPGAAQQDMTEAARRARKAKTPAAKTVTQQVVAAKRRAYTGTAARQASARITAGEHPATAITKTRGRRRRGAAG